MNTSAHYEQDGVFSDAGDSGNRESASSTGQPATGYPFIWCTEITVL